MTNIVAQLNQLRRAIEFKIANGEAEEVKELGVKAAVGGATVAALIIGGACVCLCFAHCSLLFWLWRY